jgi:hypothetical protein
MTNPNNAMRMLIIYAILIPLAILVGYLLTDPLNYGSMGFLGVVLALIFAPIFIKWHYPIMVFGLGFPMTCFFLVGRPPLAQIVVIMSLGISIVERATSSEKRFLKAPAMTLALLYTAVMAFITMKLTGGFHLHTVGGETGGGKKYISLYLGIATFFALASRGIPPAKRRLYIVLFFLPGAFCILADIAVLLPSPLNYLQLLFPPNGVVTESIWDTGRIRFFNLGNMASALMFFMVALYGLRELLSPARPWRGMLFAVLFVVSMMGGFRAFLVANILVLTFVFFLEGLHRTRWLAVVMLFAVIAAGVVVPFSRQLPYGIQRTLSFLPLNIDPVARADAEHSTEWRMNIWEAILPSVPDYLLLGKGYSISSVDYESIGSDNPFAASARANASMESLALSNDFHSGPLSTIICFGLWGAVSIIAIMLATLFILYRNFKYGDPELHGVNALLLAMHLEHILHFFFIYGAYDYDVGAFARVAGFSMALNWGVCRARSKSAVNQPIKPAPAAA